MNLRQRRKMGLTFVGVLRALKQKRMSREELEELKASDVEVLALEIMPLLVAANPQGWEDIDWDRALEILEKLLELILKFLPLFLAFL